MRPVAVACVAILGASVAGCAALGALFCAPHCNASRHSSSSLVEFLYPNNQEPPRDNSVPELQIPLRVGLAFLPAHGGSSGPDAALREQLRGLALRPRQEMAEKARRLREAIAQEYGLLPDSAASIREDRDARG